MHFALRHKILNNCNPDTPPIKLPDGREGRLVVVDDRHNFNLCIRHEQEWWPLAQSPAVARKLMRRIQYSGYVLPIVTAIAGALLSEIYTTTSGHTSRQRRYRLKYRSSPIADFGICRGSARVTSEDRLLFYSMKEKKFINFQDPNDHYWLYFTTVKGEEITLDCAMYPFNMVLMVPSAGYPYRVGDGAIGSVPCFWSERSIRQQAPPMYKERSRVSVLRNDKLHKAMRHCLNHLTEADLSAFYSLMETFSQKRMTELEKHLFKSWFVRNFGDLGDVLDHQVYKTYPASPEIGLELDPNESLNGVQWNSS